MQLSNVPSKLVLPWATSGNKNNIPVASQIGITAGAASLTDGFPPLTMTPVAAGGVPPSGLDMNGILYEMSTILRWANAGGGYAYDSAFANDSHVGGYPKGARVMRSDGMGYWLNTVDNNTTDPEAVESAAAGWVPDYQAGVSTIVMTSSTVTLTPIQYGARVITITGTLTANLNLIFPAIGREWTVVNETAGGYSIFAKTTGGSGVPLGLITNVICDGTNIISKGEEYAISVDQFGAAGDGTIDDTTFIQNALSSGKSVYLPAGKVCIVTHLTLSASGVSVFGPGTLKKKNGIDGVALTVSGSNNRILGIQFDGTPSAPTSNYVNDMVVVTGSNNVIEGNYINNSKGGGIVVLGGSKNKILHNTILSVHDNSILVGGAGSDANLVAFNHCDGTASQNCIFVTASTDSSPNGQYVYDNRVIGNYCANAGDTGIESGYHACRTIINANVILNSTNPSILMRDGNGVNITDNVIIPKAYASQVANYDQIAVVPQNETYTWPQNSRISGNVLLGAVTRSAIYVGANFVEVVGNYCRDTETAIGADGNALRGAGLIIANAVSDISATGNTFDSYFTAIDLNWESASKTLTRINIDSNIIRRSGRSINAYGVTFSACSCSKNTISVVKIAALNLINAVLNGGLKWIGNDVNLEGFSAATPLEILPATADRELCLIKDVATQVILVPENQYDNVRLIYAGKQAIGFCTVQFADDSESATFAIGGPTGAGTNSTLKILGTSNLLDSSGSTGFSGWSLQYDGSNNLIMQRRGSNTGHAARYMKVIIRDAG